MKPSKAFSAMLTSVFLSAAPEGMIMAAGSPSLDALKSSKGASAQILAQAPASVAAGDTTVPRLNFISEDRLQKLIALSDERRSTASVEPDMAEELNISVRDNLPAVVVNRNGVVYVFARMPGDTAFIMGFDKDGESRVYLVERNARLKGAVYKRRSQPAQTIGMPNALIEAQSHATMWNNAAAKLP